MSKGFFTGVSAVVSAIVQMAVIAWLGLQQNPDAPDQLLRDAVWLFPCLVLLYATLYDDDGVVEDGFYQAIYAILVVIGQVELGAIIGNVDVSLWAYISFIFGTPAIMVWILPVLPLGVFRGVRYLTDGQSEAVSRSSCNTLNC